MQVQVPFMEWERRGDSYSTHTCKIHDLMHDVALSVMENECALVPKEPSQIEWLPDTTRHLLLSSYFKPETILNDALVKRSPAIQTLLCDTNMYYPLQYVSKYSYLKALRLPIHRRSFPFKSKHLHHLRYLDLSRSKIEALPEDISILYNLQTLDVSGCYKIRRLPSQMKYMTDLRHLYTHDCPSMKSMPGDLRKLVSLQTLTCFVAGPTGTECSDVGELQQLNLAGLLELNHLENVTEEDAKAANLGDKKKLRELTLRWTVGCQDDARVLERLKPHDGLQAVNIISYGGATFPTWMGMPQNMAEIHLSGCEKLQWLFSCDTSFTFPNLKEFTLRGLICLEKWWEISNVEQREEIIFPQLEKLSIVGCVYLTGLPEATLLGGSHGPMARSAFPALKVLYLRALDNFHKWEAIEGTQRGHIIFPNLVELTIKECPLLTALPEAPFNEDNSVARSAFPALKILKLKYLRSFIWDADEGSRGEEIKFPQLEKFHVVGCEMMTVAGQRLLTLGLFPHSNGSKKGCGRMTSSSEQHKFCPKLATNAISSKLSVLNMEGTEEDMFMWVARHMTSLRNLELRNYEKTEITSSAADHSLAQVVEKGNRKDFPLSDMHLTGFKLGVTELCACFVQLQNLDIKDCDALVHWPEKEFENLVSLRSLKIRRCSKLVGYAQAPTAELSTASASSSQLLPRLESLWIEDCESMVEVFKLPASLRRIRICDCKKLNSILRKSLQQGQSAPLILQGPTPVNSEVSSSPAITRTEHFHLPCLESVSIDGCDSLTGVLDLPPSVKDIFISRCNELSSVQSDSGEMPLLWKSLDIRQCKALSSLPDGPRAYSSLEYLRIVNCPGVKRLPTCLQQLLSSLEYKELDAHLQEPSVFKPKTWRNAIAEASELSTCNTITSPHREKLQSSSRGFDLIIYMHNAADPVH